MEANMVNVRTEPKHRLVIITKPGDQVNDLLEYK
jgi:hypothetical protein